MSFDPEKEHLHILDRRVPYGGNFFLLGINVDPKLEMYNAACAFAAQAGLRLRTILRASRFYDAAALVKLYNSNVLSCVESWTPALYHAGLSS